MTELIEVSAQEISTQEFLLRAIANEAKNTAQFHEWSSRFLPYNNKISQLLDGLAEEESAHQKILEEWYRNLFGELVPPIESCENYESIEDLPGLQEHFFVINSHMAFEILQLVLENKEKARLFYETALEQISQADLKLIYKKKVLFECDHVQRVSRCLEELRFE